MKATGVSRCIDELGRIVIPKSMRNKLGINSGDPLEFRLEDGSIVITPDKGRCSFCLSDENLTSFRGKSVCTACINELKGGE